MKLPSNEQSWWTNSPPSSASTRTRLRLRWHGWSGWLLSSRWARASRGRTSWRGRRFAGWAHGNNWRRRKGELVLGRRGATAANLEDGVLKRLAPAGCWHGGKSGCKPPASAWQFDEHGHVLDGLEAVLEILNQDERLDAWAKILFFLQEKPSLGGRRPLDLLREGKLKEVSLAAQAYAE